MTDLAPSKPAPTRRPRALPTFLAAIASFAVLFELLAFQLASRTRPIGRRRLGDEGGRNQAAAPEAPRDRDPRHHRRGSRTVQGQRPGSDVNADVFERAAGLVRQLDRFLEPGALEPGPRGRARTRTCARTRGRRHEHLLMAFCDSTFDAMGCAIRIVIGDPEPGATRRRDPGGGVPRLHRGLRSAPLPLPPRQRADGPEPRPS